MPKKRMSTDYNFANVPGPNIQRSSFDRSHGHKTTFDAGFLIPILVDEALPGDTFNLKMSGFGRLATPISPIMDNMRLETFFFAVPNRLLWENWQKFNGQQDFPGDSTDYLIPTITGNANPNDLSDYFGLPVGPTFSVSALPYRAYNMIYNEWFRDQNLQDSIHQDNSDGPDTSPYQLRRRGKRHDYFTSCLPWPQKGDEVTIPLGDRADVTIDGNTTNPLAVKTTFDNNYYPIEPHQLDGDILIADRSHDTDGEMYADLTTATATTINDLREAFQIQKLFERDARGGTRYTEIIQSHFGVRSDDARLQRPEYLGGGSSPIIINEVAQTSGTSDTPQANLAATGRTQFMGHGFTKSFTEHCTIIGLMCVRADLTYQQGINRMWFRKNRFDFYWPALSHLGEQAVLSKEIYADGNNEADESVFGYQERYAEYRYKPSIITGTFRSSHPQSLDFWHLAQDFENRPMLNAEFIEEHPPVDRIIAVPSEPHFIFDSWFKLTCARPMPTYAVPGLIDHF